MKAKLGLAALLLGLTNTALAQIPKPDDAPRPLSPAESAKRFQIPPGFRLELVAAEPLVREPSGVCWNEQGHLFVCELHGYNLEGQYDIDELNKTGKLDRVVRRIQAAEQHKKAAEEETYGTIKRLHDTNGDGRMDRADVWADRLPPCLGICPARGGLIAACQTQILFLADGDGDGTAETREVLFEGFAKGPLERSINCPQWGPDGWIYFGNGAGGGLIRGEHLKEPVQLPRTDFRIRADGSAIEPVMGSTGTMGFTFTESGDRFVISTRTPGIFIAPLDWRYLARNPDLAAPRLEQAGASDQRTWPTSQPHPWRTRRAEDPGFSKYYRDRYGHQESTPNGYFTSACSPLVYRDTALPGLQGHLLACEPAQNLVHRAVIDRDGVRLTLRRAPGEAQAEFLTSSDPWFHAIALSHAPDGSLFITDFYREIIEDYSAIPRYLQQEYGLTGGKDHGRVWRLTHDKLGSSPPADMSELSTAELADEVASPRFWRRQTARRLLVERRDKGAAHRLTHAMRESENVATVLNAMNTLDQLEGLKPDDVQSALDHAAPEVRRLALRLAERWLDKDPAVLGAVLKREADEEPMVRLQLALTLGESRDARAIQCLVRLAKAHGGEPFISSAITTAIPQRAGEFLAELLRAPNELNAAEPLVEPLALAIANRRDSDELSQTLVEAANLNNARLQGRLLRGIRAGFREPVRIDLSDEARESVKRLARNPQAQVRSQALPLIALLNIETIAERAARMQRAASELADVQLGVEARLAAVYQLADDQDPRSTKVLLAALASSTPRVRQAILDAVFKRQDRLPAILDAIEAKTIAGSLLSAVQRATLLGAKEPAVRERSAALFKTADNLNAALFDAYTQALSKQRDLVHGQKVFRDKCASCHQAHSIGHNVGPDLNAEFLRAEETIVRDVLAPSASISPGYATYTIVTTAGQVVTGVLSAESPTSITLLQAEKKQQVILRKNIEQLRLMSVSMMPDDLTKTIAPKDLADAIAWLRRPPATLTLVDEDRAFLDALNEGSGTAEFVSSDQHSGLVCLQVTPPQRFSRRITGWSFRIREKPGPGEFRYLRFAWKTGEAHGAMLELADNGAWPPAEKPLRRYHAGRNTTGWKSVEVGASAPRQWTVVTRDLWRDFGDFTLTGIAPTAMGGAVLFDKIELLQTMSNE